MVKYQFKVNNLRLDQIHRNYLNQQLEVHFTQRGRGIRRFAIESWLLLPPQLHCWVLGTRFIFVYSELILYYNVSWYYQLPLCRLLSKQNKKISLLH